MAEFVGAVKDNMREKETRPCFNLDVDMCILLPALTTPPHALSLSLPFNIFSSRSAINQPTYTTLHILPSSFASPPYATLSSASNNPNTFASMNGNTLLITIPVFPAFGSIQ
jgi:hypothetical protein